MLLTGMLSGIAHGPGPCRVRQLRISASVRKPFMASLILPSTLNRPLGRQDPVSIERPRCLSLSSALVSWLFAALATAARKAESNYACDCRPFTM
jgi:hypothetical protein